jgi:hypothetical protein
VQDSLRIDCRSAQLWLWKSFRRWNKVVLCHGGHPFRVKSIRFFPSSTYPESITFGMM